MVNKPTYEELEQRVKELEKKVIDQKHIATVMNVHGASEHQGLNYASVLEAIIESSEDIIIFALDNNYRYLAFNQAHADEMMRLHGTKLYIGKDVWTFSEGEQSLKDLLRATYGRVLKGERYTVTEEMEIGGNRMWYQTSYNPIFKDGGEVIGLACFIINVTERYQLIEQLKEAKELAESANQAKSLFLANMSHELRTPLNAILGFSSILGRDSAVTPDQKKKLSVINSSGEHLLSMINDILDLSKIEAGRIKLEDNPFDLLTLLKEIGAIIKSRAEEKGLSFTLETEALGFHYVSTDAVKLRQILLNLLGNAVKFTNEGGLTLRAATELIPDTPERCQLLIEVEDTGPGIDPDMQEHIFDPFVQQQRFTAQAGTGLGLSICKTFAEVMDGSIEVESEAGKGALFRVRLPAGIVEAAAVKTPVEIKPRILGLAPGQKIPRILIADDHPENLLLMKTLLEGADFSVFEAENGKEALEAFEKETPDFIWMDMRMPIMDGYEAVRQIRRRPGGDKLPIVAITASAFRNQRPDILATGCDDMVFKPFKEHEIFETMARFLGIEYVYEEPDEAAASTDDVELTAAMLAELPLELLQDLDKTTLVANTNAILEVIERIREHAPETAESLQVHVQNFEIERIRELLAELG